MNKRLDFLISTSDTLLLLLNELESVHLSYLKELSAVKSKFENVQISSQEFKSPKTQNSRILEFTTSRDRISENFLYLLSQFDEKQENNGNILKDLEILNLEFTKLLKNMFLYLENYEISTELVKEIRDFDVKHEISSFDLQEQQKSDSQRKASRKSSVFKIFSKLLNSGLGRKSSLNLQSNETPKDASAEHDTHTLENQGQNVQVDEEGYSIPKNTLLGYSEKPRQDSDESITQESTKKLDVKIKEKASEDGIVDLDLVNAVSSLKMTLERKYSRDKSFKKLEEDSKNELQSSLATDKKSSVLQAVDLSTSQETTILIDEGKLIQVLSIGTIILHIPDSWPRTTKIVLELQDTTTFEKLEPISDLVKCSNDSFAEIDVSNVSSGNLEIPIFKFIQKPSCIQIPIEVLHTIWKKEADSKSLMMLFAYKCLSDDIRDVQIDTSITSKDEKDSITTQSKPDGMYDSSGKSMTWKFSRPEKMGKVLAKFDATSELSAGVINFSYILDSSGPNISMNGRNFLNSSVVTYKCVCK